MDLLIYRKYFLGLLIHTTKFSNCAETPKQQKKPNQPYELFSTIVAQD